MKKTIYLLIIASFLVSLAAFQAVRADDAKDNAENVLKATVKMYQENVREEKRLMSASTTSDKLEKIATPAQIALYEKIKRIGNALWGVKKETAEDNTEEASSMDNKLEKIATPAQIALYKDIKKIGTALWGIRKKVEGLTVKPAIVSAENAACVVAAIDTKDKSLQEKVNAAAASLNVAIATRSTCQQTAVRSTEGQRTNLEACVKAFKESSKTVNETARKAQSEIWKTYKTSLKACQPLIATSTGSVSTGDDKTEVSEIMIEDGSENLTDSVLK